MVRTYELRIVMDAEDPWDFIEALNEMKDREFIDHITVIEEEE
tara:strand:- start:885 stop:1013 length:129 start_codon:yes stop_codon:yes gene_type:complete